MTPRVSGIAVTGSRERYDRPMANDLAIEVVTLGECLVALIAEEFGPLASAKSLRLTVAGAEANVAVGLARLGNRVAFLGRVGRDAFGEVVLSALRADGIDVSRVSRDAAATGLLIRERRAIGRSNVLYYRSDSAGSKLDRADVEAGAHLFLRARWLHLTGITPALSKSAREATEYAIGLAREAGAIVSLDINLRRKLWRDEEAARVLRDLATRADVLLGDEEELRLVVGTKRRLDRSDLAQAAQDLGPKTVVLKLGELGSFGVELNEASMHVPGFRVTVIDPVGAGDAFAAGFLGARLRGFGLETSLLWGNACGASCVGSLGDLTGLPTIDDLESILTMPSTDANR